VTGTASCPAGKLLVGGGGRTSATNTGRAALQASYPSSTTTWTAIAILTAGNLGGGGSLTVQAYAICD
jgi:hypothetical protein